MSSWEPTPPGLSFTSPLPEDEVPGLGYSYASHHYGSSPYHGSAFLTPSPNHGHVPLPNVVPNAYGGWHPMGSPTMIGYMGLPPSPGRGSQGAPRVIDLFNPPSRRASFGVQQHRSHVLYDLRDLPETAVVNMRPKPATLNEQHHGACATHPPIPEMNIVSKLFPWTVHVTASDGEAVRVWDVLSAIHETMQQTITEPEWWIVNEDARARVSAQWLKNCATSGGAVKGKAEYAKDRKKEEGLIRVDWLGENFVMRGLERDDTFVSARMRHKEDRPLTWILTLGRSK